MSDPGRLEVTLICHQCGGEYGLKDDRLDAHMTGGGEVVLSCLACDRDLAVVRLRSEATDATEDDKRLDRLRRLGRQPGILAAVIATLEHQDPAYREQFDELYGPSLTALREGELVPVGIPRGLIEGD